MTYWDKFYIHKNVGKNNRPLYLIALAVVKLWKLKANIVGLKLSDNVDRSSFDLSEGAIYDGDVM